MRRLVAKITAFFHRLMRPQHGAELDDEPKIWDYREQDEFGCLVDSSADPCGLDENWTEASLTDIHHDFGAGRNSLLPDVDSFWPLADDEWQVSWATTLSPEAARAWAEDTCPLYFDRLLDLTPEAAKAFVQHDWVAFDAITTLSDETAEILAGYQGTCLFLRGLTMLSAEAATALRANPRIVLPEKFFEAPE